jgi:hypothetical protein
VESREDFFGSVFIYFVATCQHLFLPRYDTTIFPPLLVCPHFILHSINIIFKNLFPSLVIFLLSSSGRRVLVLDLSVWFHSPWFGFSKSPVKMEKLLHIVTKEH